MFDVVLFAACMRRSIVYGLGDVRLGKRQRRRQRGERKGTRERETYDVFCCSLMISRDA